MRISIGHQDNLKWLWIFWGEDYYDSKSEIYFRPKLWKFDWVDRGNLISITIPGFYIRHHR